MNEPKVLALKYRPKKLNDLIGQDIVAKTIFNSIKKYGPELAWDRVIRSNIMPSLEGLERNEIRCMFLHAKEVLGPTSIVTETLDRMANSDSLSLF